MKKQTVLISIFLLITLPSAGVAAETVDQQNTSDQRAACDARCRDEYQNNSAALQACLRDCGAVGPASPAGAKAVSHEATDAAQQATKVKGSKSNSSERQAAPVAPPPVPVETSNLNLSKSNINRVTEPAGAGAPPAEATTVKSSKSNSSERQAAPDSGEAPPADTEENTPAND